MAHRKAGGSTTLGRDSQSKRLGVKLYAGQKVKAGGIVIRQRGTKYHPGENVKMGSDDTIFAVKEGVIKFKKKKVRGYDGNLVQRCYVNVVMAGAK